MKQSKILVLFLAAVLMASSCKESNIKNISELSPIDQKVDSVLSNDLERKNWSDDSDKFNCNCKGSK